VEMLRENGKERLYRKQIDGIVPVSGNNEK
jgi:hypothetical protein